MNQTNPAAPDPHAAPPAPDVSPLRLDSRLHPLLALTFATPLWATAGLVAYWPLDDGPPGTEVTGAAEIVDAGLGFTDATVQGTGGTWVEDPSHGTVFSTGEDDRLVGGTQGIDLATGFTWSLWAKVASSNLDDPGADVIIGSRNGVWNKLQPTGLQRWADIRGFDVADDTWHHLAIVGTDEPRVTLYIDGVSAGSDTTLFNNITAIDDVLEFGGSSRFSEDITGLMSDIAIWDEPLPEPDIAALANGRPVIAPDTGFRVEASTYSTQENTLRLTWPADTGASYTVEFSAALNAWQVLETGITLAAGDENPGDADRITKTVNLDAAGPATSLYVRVRQD